MRFQKTIALFVRISFIGNVALLIWLLVDYIRLNIFDIHFLMKPVSFVSLWFGLIVFALSLNIFSLIYVFLNIIKKQRLPYLYFAVFNSILFIILLILNFR